MTYEQIKQRYLKMGYKFRERDLELNIFAIRSKESQSNKFDDIVGIAWRESNGKTYCITGACTTDPGKYYLQNPMNKDGCIITVPGQYLNVFEKGLHAGKYDCFKQCAPIMYIRDNNKDTILDFPLYRDPEKRKKYAFWGINGTNLHRASEWQIVQWVERYSAGCTVVQNSKFFNTMIDVRDKSIEKAYNKFDFTLFEDL